MFDSTARAVGGLIGFRGAMLLKFYSQLLEFSFLRWLLSSDLVTKNHLSSRATINYAIVYVLCSSPETLGVFG